VTTVLKPRVISVTTATSSAAIISRSAIEMMWGSTLKRSLDASK
jgi:hypothetical protein